MKQLWRITERYYPWLLLLLGVDCFCAIILWISDIQAFQPLIGLVVLTSLLLFSAILFVLNKRETTRREPVSYTHLDVYKRQTEYHKPLCEAWRSGR